MSMMRRAIPNASSLEEASQIVRGNWLRAIEQHHLQYSGDSGIRDILDIGCSVGVSTRLLADKFPSANVTVSGSSPSVFLWFFFSAYHSSNLLHRAFFFETEIKGEIQFFFI